MDDMTEAASDIPESTASRSQGVAMRDVASHASSEDGSHSQTFCLGRVQACVGRMLGQYWFDLIIGVFIVANSIVIGLDQSVRLGGSSLQQKHKITSNLEILEHFFL